MKTRFYFHPSSFSLSETEEFYEKKARKGLLLDKRGRHLSRFQKGEGVKLRYRVEVVDIKKTEDRKIPEEQIAVYEECGWKYVSGHDYIHIFVADLDADVPELYYQPEDQIGAVKILRKSNLKEMLSMVMVLLFLFFMDVITSYNRSVLSVLRENREMAVRTLLNSPAQYMGAWLVLAFIFMQYVLAFVSCEYYISKLKKGIPLRKIRPFAKRLKTVMKGSVILALLLVLLMGGIELFSTVYKPGKDDERNYIRLEELTLSAKEEEQSAGLPGDYYRKHKTIFGKVLITSEHTMLRSDVVSLIQEVYVVKNKTLRDRLVKALCNTTMVGWQDNDIQKVSVPGLDEAYVKNKLEIIAVKDQTVVNARYYDVDLFNQKDLFLKLSELLNKEGQTKNE